MTDWLLGLVPQYGLWLLAATTFLSCLALPIPASAREGQQVVLKEPKLALRVGEPVAFPLFSSSFSALYCMQRQRKTRL